MKRAIVILAAAAVLVSLTGCMESGTSTVRPHGPASNRRAVLYSYRSDQGPTGAPPPSRSLMDAMAADRGRSIEEVWLREIARRAHEAPARRFRNLSQRVFRQRVAAAASRYGFTVKKMRFLHPRQLAPLVVVETRHYVGLAHAVSAIEKSLGDLTDPPAFEGLLFEAEDERGVPFLATSSFWRGSNPCSGRWARAEALDPVTTAPGC